MMNSQVRFWCVLGAIAMAAAVTIGAFGAHGLQASTTPPRLATFETGVRYHVYHALGLFAVAFVAQYSSASAWIKTAGVLMLAGIALFSGSLYALVLTDLRWLGAVAPLGGTAFILGWAALALAVAAGKARAPAPPDR